MRRIALVVSILLPGAALRASAQETTTCYHVDRPGSEAIGTQGGAVMTFVNPMFRCDGGTRTMTADNANFSQAARRIDLFGNVVIQDAERTLTTDRAVYLSAQRRLEAIGNGVLTDRTTGSVIRGDLINMYLETATRPQRVEATATSGIARAILKRVEPGAAPDSTIIDAHQINIEGEQSFRAIGNAVLTRDSLRATGHSIEYRQESGAMMIAGAGLVMLPRQELRGDSIDATLGDDEQIREVLTRHNASLTAPEMEVRAGAVRLFFEEGAVSRMVAMNWEPVRGAPAPGRPRVDAEEFLMVSDSIDVLAPGGEISEAAAIGNAYGERITPDSLRARLPEVSARDSALIASDWMRGDTVRAFFVANPDTVSDASAEARVMDRLMAAGSPAQSVYRIVNVDRPDDALSVNYLSAQRIEVQFAKGVVFVVTAEGDAKGVYVQPASSARRVIGGGAPRQ
ncbi:MAG TPA: hypothetical protein VK928_11985 [Longimicrobiales bacterium]|nr:hypothetical protein [Longimicrobiales bacterium]